MAFIWEYILTEERQYGHVVRWISLKFSGDVLEVGVVA
jgi:hypothetical protein